MKIFIVFGEFKKHTAEFWYNYFMMNALSNWFRWFLIAAIIAAAGLLMVAASWQDSAVVEEPIHLNNILSALPILTQKLDFSANPDLTLYWLRLLPVAGALILLMLLYIFTKQLIGRWWAILPIFFLAFSPTLIAKGHYLTSDIGTALGLFIALWSFLIFLHNRTGKNLMLAGLTFGLAQLLNLSLIVLTPLFAVLMVVFYFTRLAEDWPFTDPIERFKRFSRRAMRYFKYLIAIFLVGFLLVYCVFLLRNWNSPPQEENSFLPETANRLLTPITAYSTQLSSHLNAQRPIFFLGTIYDSAPIYYLPAIFVLKEPLAGVLITLAALLIGSWKFVKGLAAFIFRRTRKPLEYFSTNFPEFAMIIVVGFYWASGNLKVLPILPFIYILTVENVKRWFSLQNIEKVRNFVLKINILTHEFVGLSVKTIILTAVLIWFAASAVLAYPNFNSYFNIAASGMVGGYKFLNSENYDWGQDLKRLAVWAKTNLSPEEKIAVDYYGGGDPRYYLGQQFEPWLSAKGTPATDDIRWIAISATRLQMAKTKIAGHYQRKPEDEYEWLVNSVPPYAKIGGIFVYQLERGGSTGNREIPSE